jgi:basic membrane protein A
MKKTGRICIAMLIVVSLLTIGCGAKTSEGDKSKASSPAPSAKEEKVLKVALLMSGPISDMGYNAGGYDGLQKAKAKFGDKIEINYQESIKNSDAEEVLRNYALDGYKLIIGHGFQFTDPIKKVAKEFPDVYFSISSGREFVPPNVAAVATGSKEQGFLMGAVAALLTKSNVVAAIAGQEMPPAKDCLSGFEQGAKYANPSVKVLATFTGSNEDAGKAKETALSMIGQGADIVMTNADQAGLGSIEACTQKGILGIGSNMDQNNVAPDTIVVSGIKEINTSVVFIVEKVLNNEFEAKKYILGVKEGAVYLSPWHGFESKVSQEVKDKLKAITDDISSGKIVMQ